MSKISAWRMGDVAAYDAMRDTADAVVSLLLSRPSSTVAEVAAVRAGALAVDPYAREDIEAFQAALDRHLQNFADPT